MRLVRVLLNPGIFAAVVVSALFVALAYQARPGYDIQLGTPTDRPFLDGFHTGEFTPPGANLGYGTFRWMTGYGRVTFQDVGVQPFTASLTVNGTRPPGQPAPTLRAEVAGRTLLDVQPPPAVTTYTFDVPAYLVAAQNGSFTLELSTNAFHIKGDPRELGIISTRLQVQPGQGGSALVKLQMAVLVSVVASAALLALVLAAIGWGPLMVGLVGSVPGLLAGWLLAFDRLWLTSVGWYGRWPAIVLLGGVAVALAWFLGGWLLRRGAGRWTALEGRVLLTILLAAVIFRFGGQLHPEILVFDLGFHVNHLHLVEQGQLLFTTQPAEFGGFGHSTFYLPTPYLFVIPLNWLLNDENMAVRVLTVTLGSLGVLPVYYIVRRLLHDGRAGLLAACMYVILPMAVLPYSWGITPNVFGEFFMLCALAVAVGNFATLNPRRPAFWLLALLLMVALLSHPGVFATTAVAFVLLPALWFAGQRRARSVRRGAAWTLGALTLAGVAAFALYFNHFVGQMLDSLSRIGAERTSEGGSTAFERVVGGSVEDKSLGLINYAVHTRRAWVLGLFDGLWREAVAYYRAWPLLGSALGLIVVWPSRRGKRLALAGFGWLAVVALFALVGWATNVYVRYMLSALPIVAIGCGVLLSRIWRRGSMGRWLALGVVVLFAVQAAALWHYRIDYSFK